MGPWDRVALAVDTRREDVAVRLFNPDRALVWNPESDMFSLLLTGWPSPSPSVSQFLSPASGAVWTVVPPVDLPGEEQERRFANGLALVDVRWLGDSARRELLTVWRVAAPLDLPPLPIVANPPPPGVYAGLRLAVFMHLLGSDGTLVAGDDGLWVDPLTLRPGDRFLQIHRLAADADASAGPYTVALGLYDPLTGGRWAVLDAAGKPAGDHVLSHPSQGP
jgi:hypothetical protein